MKKEIEKRTIKIPNIELPVGIPIVIEEVVKGRYGYNIFPQGKERNIILDTIEGEVEKQVFKKWGHRCSTKDTDDYPDDDMTECRCPVCRAYEIVDDIKTIINNHRRK